MTKQEWKIGDCLELLPEIEDKSIDMILTDLPYGTTACSWDTIIPFEPLWGHYKRIIKDNGAVVLTASQPFTTALISSNIAMFKYCWVWEKSRAVGFPNAKNKPMNSHEDVIVFSFSDCANGCLNRMQYNPQGLRKFNKKVSGVKECKADSGGHSFSRPSHTKKHLQEYTKYPNSVIKISNEGNTLHPTQKPVDLFEYLIKTYTNEGDTVHDSCLGSGTTLEACMNTNRNCMGFEISDEWVPYYKKRLRSDNTKLAEWL